jgi:hypothetical protein
MLFGFAVALTGNPAGLIFFAGGMVFGILGAEGVELNQETIDSVQAQIAALEPTLTTDTAAYTAVQNTSQQLTALQTSLGQMTGPASLVQPISTFVNQELTGLQQLASDVQSAQQAAGDWGQVISDIQSAQTEWQQIQQSLAGAQQFALTFDPATGIQLISATGVTTS